LASGGDSHFQTCQNVAGEGGLASANARQVAGRDAMDCDREKSTYVHESLAWDNEFKAGGGGPWPKKQKNKRETKKQKKKRSSRAPPDDPALDQIGPQIEAEGRKLSAR